MAKVSKKHHPRRKEQAVLTLGVTQVQIVELLGSGCHSIAEIANEIDVKRDNIYSTLSRMRKVGLIETDHELMRAPSTARRYQNAVIRLTEDGERFARGFKALIDELGPRLTDVLLRC